MRSTGQLVNRNPDLSFATLAYTVSAASCFGSLVLRSGSLVLRSAVPVRGLRRSSSTASGRRQLPLAPGGELAMDFRCSPFYPPSSRCNSLHRSAWIREAMEHGMSLLASTWGQNTNATPLRSQPRPWQHRPRLRPHLHLRLRLRTAAATAIAVAACAQPQLPPSRVHLPTRLAAAPPLTSASPHTPSRTSVPVC